MEALTSQTIDGDLTVSPGQRTLATSRALITTKRMVDVVGSMALLLVFAPLLLVILSAALLTSGRPLLFRQRRVGQDGREFEILKLRSMRTDAEHSLRSTPGLEASYLARGYKLPCVEDPRVTGLGRVIRRFDLDELPQLWNVLRGDMSLVGPRPVPEPELLMYGSARVHYESVKPGLTGLWQVSGRNEISYPERVALDVQYVEDISLLLDLTVMLRTPRVLLRPNRVPAGE
jgi:lipopolysaccharide/colanic/teichoic acid biosynthesis glycosyltransferase